MAITRRHWIRSAALGGAATALPSPAAAATTRPNFLFLFTDDQRFNTIGALGNPEVRTPNLDRLVRRGVRTPNLDRLVRRGVAFTHAFNMGGTVGAVCIPSRAMLLSGQSLFRAHRRLIDPAGGGQAALFPELLRQAGYDTFGIGKWHNGPRLYGRCFSGGANVFFGGMSDQYKVPVQDFDPSGEYAKSRLRTGQKASSELFADSAVEFLTGRRSRNPFLLYVAFTSPHDPRTAPREYHVLYPPERVRLPENFAPEHPFDNGEMKVRDEMLAPFPRTPEVIRRHIADYYAMISHVDAQIGRVLGALESSGEASNTVIVFAADNGLAVGQHGLMGKQNLYDHSVRVPLVVSGPGLPRGRRRDQFCYLLDLCPTICELAGIAAPDAVEGRSLLPLIRDAGTPSRDSVFLAYRHFQRAVRTRDYKLIVYNVAGRRTTQLFHVKQDPWERNNLAGDPSQAGRARELTALLRDWMKRTGDPADLDRPEWSPAGGPG